MLANPVVQQRISRPGIKPCNGGSVSGQDGYVRDTTDIQDCPVRFRASKQPFVKAWGEWRALAANRHVGAAKVGDGRDAGSCCDNSRVADLQCKRLRCQWLMPQGLSMTANGGYCASIDTSVIEQCVGCIAKTLARPAVECADIVYRAVLRFANCGAQSLAKVGGIFVLACLQNFERRLSELNQCGIDAVHAGAGNQADVVITHRCFVY